MKYTIAIEESVVHEFEVFAENDEVALKIAKENYKNGKFVLEPGEVQHKQMSIVNPFVEKTKWIEF